MRAATAALLLLLCGAAACATSSSPKSSSKGPIDPEVPAVAVEPSEIEASAAPFVPAARALDEDAYSAERGSAERGSAGARSAPDGAGQGSQGAVARAIRKEAESLRILAEVHQGELERIDARERSGARAERLEELRGILHKVALRLDRLSSAIDDDPALAEDGSLHQELSEIRILLMQVDTLLRLYAH